MSTGYSIAYIERSTGISRETLRIWERRYGFPRPDRDANGDRSYSEADLERLRVIKRLLDSGHRPGRIVPTGTVLLPEAADLEGAERAEGGSSFGDFLALLRTAAPEETLDWLRRRMRGRSLEDFTTRTLAPLTRTVGDAWAAGRLCVHEEHLYTEMVGRLLRGAIDALPKGGGAPVLLATLPEERHGLGLLMVEAVMRAAGARCLNPGVDIPIPEILGAVARHEAVALALSFSPAYPRRRIGPQLEALRRALPEACGLWVGGLGVARLRPMPGVRFCLELEEAPRLLAELAPAEMG